MSKIILIGILCILLLATTAFANKKSDQAALNPAHGGGHGDGGHGDGGHGDGGHGGGGHGDAGHGGHGGGDDEGKSVDKSSSSSHTESHHAPVEKSESHSDSDSEKSESNEHSEEHSEAEHGEGEHAEAEGEEEGEEGEHHIEYTMEHELLAVSLIILALIMLSLGIEVCTEALEEFLKKKHVEEMLFKMYKELMILGICGLFLFVEEKYHFLEKSLGEFDKHIFEHVHMTLFMIVIVYIFVTCLLMGYSIWVANHYKEIEQEAKTDKGKASILETWRDFERKGKEQGYCGHFLNLRWNYQYNKAYLRFQYVELRRHFIEQHRHEYPEMDHDFFEFYVYLRKCVRQACIGIAMIHWQVWLFILAIVFLNTVRIVAFETSEVSSFVILDSIVMWLVTFYIFYLRHNTIATIKTLTIEYEQYQRLSESAHESEHEEEEEADEEEAKHHENERIMKGGPGCCGRGDAHKQQKMFPFHSPAHTTRGIQLALLLISISIPLYFFELSQTIANSDGIVKIVVNLCMGLPPVLLLTLGIPPIIPRFVICSSVASMSRPTMIRDTIKKLKREAAHKKKHGHKKEEESHGCCGKRAKQSPNERKSKHNKHQNEEEEEEKGLTSNDPEHA